MISAVLGSVFLATVLWAASRYGVRVILGMFVLMAVWGVAQAKTPDIEFRKANPCPSGDRPRQYGCAGWYTGHIIPRCAGGADHPSNMEWYPRSEHKARKAAHEAQCRAYKPEQERQRKKE